MQTAVLTSNEICKLPISLFYQSDDRSDQISIRSESDDIHMNILQQTNLYCYLLNCNNSWWHHFHFETLCCEVSESLHPRNIWKPYFSKASSMVTYFKGKKHFW